MLNSAEESIPICNRMNIIESFLAAKELEMVVCGGLQIIRSDKYL